MFVCQYWCVYVCIIERIFREIAPMVIKTCHFLNLNLLKHSMKISRNFREPHVIKYRFFSSISSSSLLRSPFTNCLHVLTAFSSIYYRPSISTRREVTIVKSSAFSPKACSQKRFGTDAFITSQSWSFASIRIDLKLNISTYIWHIRS